MSVRRIVSAGLVAALVGAGAAPCGPEAARADAGAEAPAAQAPAKEGGAPKTAAVTPEPPKGTAREGDAAEGATLKLPPGKWVPLFNGRDLAGWKVKICGHELGENYGRTFRLEDGLLKVSYDRYEDFQGKFGHLFYERPLAGDYRLRVEYRFVGEQVPGGPRWAFRNSGIMIHGQSPESMGKDQKFPVSIEVQLLGGRHEGERPTANLCTPGTHVVRDGELITRHVTNSRSGTYRGNRWVTVEVEVRDDTIKHICEGKTVLSYTDPQLDERDRNAAKLLAAGREKMLRGGTISLQSESHPIEFRRIEVMKLGE